MDRVASRAAVRSAVGVVAVVAVVLAVGACADGAGREVPGAQPGTPSPSATATPSPSASATPTDTSLPPAVQGLEPCPGEADRKFVLREGGVRIEGFRRGSGDRVVILTHQIRGTPCDLAALGASAADAGFRVVAWTTDRGATLEALRVLVEHERAHGAEYVALVGASMGAATSIAVSPKLKPPVDAVVALSPSTQSDREGDVVAAAARYAGPLMVVAGEFDSTFADLPPELAKVHDGEEHIEVVDGSSDHGKYLVYRRTDPWVGRVLGFLGE